MLLYMTKQNRLEEEKGEVAMFHFRYRKDCKEH